MSLRRAARSPFWQEELFELEQRLLDPAVRSSPMAVTPLLHPDFREFGSSGKVYTKEMMVQMMMQQTPGVVKIREFEVNEVSEDVALVTYRTIGDEGRETRRSSIWLRRDTRWQIIFHQGTRLRYR